MTADTLPAQLTSACPQTRPGTADDAVAGVVPGYVAAPATEAEATALLAAAAGLDLAVLPRGGGTRLGWGAAPGPVRPGGRHPAAGRRAGARRRGPGRPRPGGRAAGRPWRRVLAGAGQRLAVDPPDAGGTVGGLIAAGVAGPLRLRYGLPRDLLIGITMIRADGVLTRAGGKVVKNVAGYDTGKLLAGSFGTLGLITEATFRLHPVPPAVRYVAADYARPQAAAAALLAVASSTLVPAAAELDWPRANAPVSVGVRLEGDPDGVTERAERLRGLLGELDSAATGVAVSDTPPPWWSAPDDDGTMLEISFWASRLAGILGQIRAAATAAGLDPAIGGSGAAGVLHAALPPDAEPGAVAQFVTALRAGLPAGRASAVVRHAPAPVRDAVDLWGPVPSAGLMRAVKDQFDPGHRMAPGRFAGGI